MRGSLGEGAHIITVLQVNFPPIRQHFLRPRACYARHTLPSLERFARIPLRQAAQPLHDGHVASWSRLTYVVQPSLEPLLVICRAHENRVFGCLHSVLSRAILCLGAGAPPRLTPRLTPHAPDPARAPPLDGRSHTLTSPRACSSQAICCGNAAARRAKGRRLLVRDCGALAPKVIADFKPVSAPVP